MVSRRDKRFATCIMIKEAHMSFPTVLIVDDSRLSRMMIRAFITQAYPDWTIPAVASRGWPLIRTVRSA